MLCYITVPYCLRAQLATQKKILFWKFGFVATSVSAGHTFPLLPTTSMQTCSSSPLQPPPEALPPHPPEASGKAQWTEANEIVLIDYNTEHKAKVSDGTKIQVIVLDWCGKGDDITQYFGQCEDTTRVFKQVGPGMYQTTFFCVLLLT